MPGDVLAAPASALCGWNGVILYLSLSSIYLSYASSSSMHMAVFSDSSDLLCPRLTLLSCQPPCWLHSLFGLLASNYSRVIGPKRLKQMCISTFSSMLVGASVGDSRAPFMALRRGQLLLHAAAVLPIVCGPCRGRFGLRYAKCALYAQPHAFAGIAPQTSSK